MCSPARPNLAVASALLLTPSSLLLLLLLLLLRLLLLRLWHTQHGEVTWS
jgi:hypothetical protein